MDLVDGLRCADAVQAGSELRDRWGEAIFRFTLGSMRRIRLFNADPHPGNYLFHPDGTVTFLDFGCIQRTTRQQVDAMAQLTQATTERNPDKAQEWAVAAGFVDPADPPTPAELLAWCDTGFEPMLAPQPFTYTTEHAARMAHDGFSPYGPHAEVLRKLTAHSDYLSMGRVELGMTAVLGALRATGPWNAIRQELDGVGPPTTPYGEQEHAYQVART
jgi:hypothetical protein